MRVVPLIGLLLLSTVIAAAAQTPPPGEAAVPITPVEKTVKAYKVVSLMTARKPDWRIVITYEDDQGGIYTDEHNGPCPLVVPPEGGEPAKSKECAEDLIKAYNTMNFSTNSQAKRTLQHLIDHGKIPPSTIQGTPETFTESALKAKPPLPPPPPPKVKK